jgi:lipopolysaccharide export system permease protein
MPLYARYLARRLLGPLLFATALIGGAVWLSQSLRFLDLVIGKGVALGALLRLLVLLLPSLLLATLPIAVFAAVLFVYARLAGDGELGALQAAGVSRCRLALPSLAVAGLASLACLGLSLEGMPTAHRAFVTLERELWSGVSLDLLEPGVFLEPVAGITLFIGERGAAGEVRNILVHDGRRPDRPVTLLAEAGRVLPDAARPRLLLLHGSRQERAAAGGVAQLFFESYVLDLVDDAPRPAAARKPKERHLGELLAPEDTGNDRRGRTRLVAHGHERLLQPLLPLVLTAVALAILLPAVPGEPGRMRRVALAALAGLLVQLAFVLAASLAARTLWLVPLLHLVVLVPLLLAAARLGAGGAPVRSRPRSRRPMGRAFAQGAP